MFFWPCDDQKIEYLQLRDWNNVILFSPKIKSGRNFAKANERSGVLFWEGREVEERDWGIDKNSCKKRINIHNNLPDDFLNGEKQSSCIGEILTQECHKNKFNWVAEKIFWPLELLKSNPWFLATLWRWLLMSSKSKIFEIILNFVFFEETQKHKVIKNLVFSVCWWLKLVVLDQLGIFYKCYD